MHVFQCDPAVNRMRALLSLLVCISSVQAWNIRISPNGERLANRKVGDNFLVVCSVVDYEGPKNEVKIEWFKDEKIIQMGRVMTMLKSNMNANQLFIVKARADDSAGYTCRAEVQGETKEEVAKISFIRPPEFVDVQPEQHPEEGLTAEIVCKVDGDPGFEIFWQFNGNTLNEASPRGYDFKEDNQILVIPNYDSKKDDGMYLCNAAQHSSFETQTINVSGYSRPVITVFEGPENNRSFEGHAAQFKCQAIGKPKPTYKWFNVEDNEEITPSDLYTLDDGLLVINHVTGTDEGHYKCEAENAIGKQERTVKLSVFLRPIVEKIANITKQEKDSVDLLCSYSGEGVVKAKFVYGSQEYAVVEESEEGTTESSDNSLVKDEDDEDEEEEETGNDNDDENEENGETMRWKRDVTSGRVSVRAENNRLILTINDLQQEDAGAYQCVVENEAGEVTRTANLAITHAPVMKSWTESKIRSFDGHEVELSCRVKAVPEPTWTWILDGNEIEADGVAVRINSHYEQTTMTLRTSAGKYGTYACKADNGVGEPVEKTIEVIEVFAPAPPKQLNCQEHVYPNYGTCTFGVGEYDQESTRPTEVQFFYAPAADVSAEVDWESTAKSVKVPFSDKMRITGLATNTGYVIAARVSNEAGTSDIGAQGSIETTDPWAPEKPESVTVECDDACLVSWIEPNSHGSEITGYRITVREYTQEENSDEKVYTGSELLISVGPTDQGVELTQLKPTSRYEVSVNAVNVIGSSDARITAFETPASLSPLMGTGFSSSQLIIVVLGVLALLCAIVDVICFATNRCGLLACICINCLGRNPDRKQKDLEAGNRPESNRLLDGATR